MGTHTDTAITPDIVSADLLKMMQAIAAGDRKAFAALVCLYQRPLFSFLGRMGLDQGHAEDIAQDAFLKVWTHAARFDARRAQPKTWLFGIARNLALNDLTSAARRREVQALEVHEDLADHNRTDEGRTEGCSGPAQWLEQRQQHDLLIAAIRTLGADDRSVLALAYVQELDMVDIASIEHSTPGAVKTRLSRVRHKLRALLESSHD
jgi:RNA polymerase sigma-70 factor, ECF subfamily